MSRLASEVIGAYLWLERTEWRLRDSLEVTLLIQGRDDVIQPMVGNLSNLERYLMDKEAFRVVVKS